jgi:uncharacterized membrane protein YfcA
VTGRRLLRIPNRRHSEGFVAGAGVAVLAGLVGLGGAEFRLPILKGWFRLPSLKAVIFNKAVSLVVVFFALIFRAQEVPFGLLADHAEIILNLLGGSLAGAWFSAGMAMRLSEAALDRAIMLLLVALAVLLLFHSVLTGGNGQAFFDAGWAQVLAGLAAGFGIGMVAAILGVAGGELLIPAIVLLYGVDIKLAGSLSLAISLPTMLVGFVRYSKGAAFSVLKEEGALLAAVIFGSVLGAAAGAMLLGVVSADALIVVLALMLMLSAYKIFKHTKGGA